MLPPTDNIPACSLKFNHPLAFDCDTHCRFKLEKTRNGDTERPSTSFIAAFSFKLPALPPSRNLDVAELGIICISRPFHFWSDSVYLD